MTSAFHPRSERTDELRRCSERDVIEKFDLFWLHGGSGRMRYCDRSCGGLVQAVQCAVCPSHWSPHQRAPNTSLSASPLHPTHPSIHPLPLSLSLSPDGSLACSVFQRGVQNNTSHHSIKLYVPPFHAPYLSSFDFSIGRPWEIHSGTLFNSTGPFLSSSPCLSDGQRARGVILLFRHLFISFFLSVGQNAMISCWAGVLSSFSLSFLSCSSLRAPLLPLWSTQAMTYSFTPGFIMFGHAFLTVCFF